MNMKPQCSRELIEMCSSYSLAFSLSLSLSPFLSFSLSQSLALPPILSRGINKSIYIYINIYIYIYIYMCVCVCVCDLYMYIWMYVLMYKYGYRKVHRHQFTSGKFTGISSPWGKFTGVRIDREESSPHVKSSYGSTYILKLWKNKINMEIS